MALRQDELTSLCDDVDLDRDRALVERCQAGDSAAFGNLYRALLRTPAALLPAEAERPPRGRGRGAGGLRPRLEGPPPLRRGTALLSLAHRDRRQHLHGHAAPPLAQHADRRHGADRAASRRCGRRGHLRGARVGRSRRRAGQPCARPPLDAPPSRAGDARGLGMDVPADRRPRGCRDRDDRDAPVAGPPGPQARVRRRVRIEGRARRLPHRHRRALPPQHLPAGTPGRIRAAPERRHRGPAQRRRRRGGDRRCRRGGVHRPARAVGRAEPTGGGLGGFGAGCAAVRARRDGPGCRLDRDAGWGRDGGREQPPEGRRDLRPPVRRAPVPLPVGRRVEAARSWAARCPQDRPVAA